MKPKSAAEVMGNTAIRTETLLMLGRAQFHLLAALTVMSEDMRINLETAHCALSARATAAVLNDLLIFCGDPDRNEAVRLRLSREARELHALGPCIMEH